MSQLHATCSRRPVVSPFNPAENQPDHLVSSARRWGVRIQPLNVTSLIGSTDSSLIE